MSEEHPQTYAPDNDGAPLEKAPGFSSEEVARLELAKRRLAWRFRFDESVAATSSSSSLSSSRASLLKTADFDEEKEALPLQSKEADREARAARKVQATAEFFGEVKTAGDLLGTAYYYFDDFDCVEGGNCYDDYERPPPTSVVPDDGCNYYAEAFCPVPIYENDPAVLSPDERPTPEAASGGKEEIKEGTIEEGEEEAEAEVEQRPVRIESGLFWYRVVCAKHLVVKETADAVGGKPVRGSGASGASGAPGASGAAAAGGAAMGALRGGGQERLASGAVVAAVTRAAVRADPCSGGFDQVYLRLRPPTRWDEATGDMVTPLPWEPVGDFGTKSRWIYCAHPVHGPPSDDDDGGGGDGAGCWLATELSMEESSKQSEALFRAESAETARRKEAIALRKKEVAAAAAAEAEAALQERKVAMTIAVAGEVKVAKLRQQKRRETWEAAHPKPPTPPLEHKEGDKEGDMEETTDEKYGELPFSMPEMPELPKLPQINFEMPEMAFEMPEIKLELPNWW